MLMMAFCLCFILASIAAYAAVPYPYDQNWPWYNNILFPNTIETNEYRNSDHFLIIWGNNGVDVPYWNEQMAQGNLQMLEQYFHILFDTYPAGIGFTHPGWSFNPSYQEVGKFIRADLAINQTGALAANGAGFGGGAWGSCDGYGLPLFGLPPGYLRYDPPSGATPHEYGHTVLINKAGFNGTPWDGCWHEATANWLELQIDNAYPLVGAQFWNHAASMPHGRNYYDAWWMWEYFKDNPDKWGGPFVAKVWTEGHGDQNKYNPPEGMMDSWVRLDTSGAVDHYNAIKDAMGCMARQNMTWESYARGQFFRQECPLQSDPLNDQYRRGYSELEKMPGSTTWWRLPWKCAPSLGGEVHVPIALNNKNGAGGYVVNVNFQPLWDGVRGSDFRATLVAVNDQGNSRYSTMWNCGTNSMTLSADENKLYLVAIATPDFKPFGIGTGNPINQSELFPQTFMVSFPSTQAGTYMSMPTVPAGVAGHAHSNGGGFVANTATVDASAYVGPNAMVLDTAKVLGNAKILDYAVVKNNATVKDNAIVSGHGYVRDSAQVSGYAKVRDWGTVVNGSQVFDYGKVLDEAYADNEYLHDNGTLKGWTYDYAADPGVYGYAIKDGDCANGSTIDHGVVLCWVWGFDQNYCNTRPDIGWRFCEYNFEKYSPIYAWDTYGNIHGYLMGASTKPSYVTDSNTTRNNVLSLNGTDQYIELYGGAIDFIDATYNIWVKWNGGAANQKIWSMGDGANKYMYLTPSDTNGKLKFVITNSGSAGEQSIIANAIPTTTWKMLTVMFSGDTVTLYVDGVSVGSAACTLNPDSLMGANIATAGNCNYIGRGNTGSCFSGYVDSFTIFQRAFSDTEVAALVSLANSSPGAAIVTETTAPTPNPTGFLQVPTALNDNVITMSANRGTDASGYVEYYFTCTAGGGHNSGWISTNKYTDLGLTPATTYTYTVKMRDRFGNTTSASEPVSVATPADSGAPTNVTWLVLPRGSKAETGTNGDAAITMTATPVTSSSGAVEYKFNSVLPMPPYTNILKTSGWQSSNTWTDTGLHSNTSCLYNFQVRNARGAASALSSRASATAVDTTPPTRYTTGEWGMQPYATIDNCVSMTAMDVKAINNNEAIKYRFICTSGATIDSGWQDSATFKTAQLADGTYSFKFQLKDAAGNVSSDSSIQTATITPTTGYHTCTISQLSSMPDENLVSFTGTVMKVYPDYYAVRDLVSGASIKVRSNTNLWATDSSLALKNVRVNGHLYTFGGSKLITSASLTNLGDPSLYNISGRVTNSSGAGISGATVYFSDIANASANAVTSVTTDSGGYYSKGLTEGMWFVAATAPAYNSSLDKVVIVSGSNVPNTDFVLAATSIVTGKVIRKIDSAPLTGATVYFSKTAMASSSPAYTATTDASGNYSQPLQDGTWYVCAGASGYYTSADKVVIMGGVNISGIGFTLKPSARNIPTPSDLLFSAVTEDLPASGATGPWPVYLPDGLADMTTLSSPTVESINGVKWEKNLYSDGDGFQQSNPADAIPINGATIVVAAKPTRNTIGTSWTSIVDIMYSRLTIGIRNNTGQVVVRRNGTQNDSSATIPDGQITILSIVVQPNGAYKVYANGTQIMNITSTSAMTSWDPNTSTWGATGQGFWSYINVGRSQPDGWSTFNGYIGDVFVYKTALVDEDRTILETDLSTKFLVTDYTIAASAGAGGYINPAGSTYVAPGGSQTYTITALPGYAISDVKVDGVSRGAITTYTFSSLSANHTISATFSSIIQSVTSTSALKAKPIGTYVTLNENVTVTYAPVNNIVRTTKFFYVGETRGLGGLQVRDFTSDSLALGNQISGLTGIVQSDSGEVYLQLIQNPGIPTVGTGIKPLLVNNRVARNDNKAATNAVKVWGKIKTIATGNTSFTIDDGYGNPITVMVNSVPLPSGFAADKMVVVTGVLGTNKVIQAQSISF